MKIIDVGFWKKSFKCNSVKVDEMQLADCLLEDVI